MAWWEGHPDERYWLEVTDREDLGVDLNAPLEREGGDSYWSYSFVRDVNDGDVILHYRARPTGAITHWSRAVGEPYEDEVVWGAHGQASGRGPVVPYRRPGVRHPLDGPYPLAAPVTKEQLRGIEAEIREVRDALLEVHGEPLYFPFQISENRPTRAFQGYLTKFPAALVARIPELAEVGETASRTAPTPDEPAPGAEGEGIGGTYREADPPARTAHRRPFAVDPNLVDRALRSHAEIQEMVAAAVRDAGLIPLSPRPGEPEFDIAWRSPDGVLVVAEVKSLTDANEEKQLRLALGQVLRYSHLLSRDGTDVSPVIVGEREPRDGTWPGLCEGAGVILVWPETVPSLFG